MIVHNNLNKNYWEDPLRFWNFDLYKDLAPDNIHVYIGCDFDAMKNSHVDGKKICCHFEEVYDQFDTTDEIITPYCDKILTISKTAAENKPKRQYVYFPLPVECLPEIVPPDKKIYDVIYTGNYNDTQPVPEIFNTLSNMSTSTYALVSFATPHYADKITHSNVTYHEKLKLISQSKITVTHNSTRGYAQLKSRSFEAAFNKSLILCCEKYCNYMDPWFKNGEHFITFKEGQLHDTLKDLINNYNDYHDMIDKTYDLAINNYTTKHFVNDFFKI